MTKKLEIYKCNICKNVVEITSEGSGTLVCCGENMHLLEENVANKDNAHFAHLEKLDELTKKITFNHVMSPEHHIEYIEAISKDMKYVKRKFLIENETPEMVFRCECKEGFYIRLYCNIDQVWVTQV